MVYLHHHGKVFVCVAMLRQASAQRLQASAHFWQCSIVCLAHSVAQASHAVAHSVHTAAICVPTDAMDVAARRQISAHSKSRAMHLAMRLGLSSARHEVAHCRQAEAQSLHARRHSISLGVSISSS